MLENSTTVRAETVDKAVKIGLTRLGITEAPKAKRGKGKKEATDTAEKAE